MTTDSKPNQFVAPPFSLTDSELKKFVTLIYDECGISLSLAKKSMLSARLGRRLRALNMGTFKEYYTFLTETLGKNDEMIHMLDVVTTNTTHFFRESNHFKYLTDEALPQLTVSSDAIKIWSAGCSSGEEPYTLTMVLSDYFARNAGDFSILASDISTNVLKKAKLAVYSDEDVEGISPVYRNKYLMRGKGEQAGNWRIIPELRKKVHFHRLNFMDDNYGIDDQFDIIFCRNVIIYFDWDTKARLINRFYDHLAPGGYLFIGHSETLNGMNENFKAVAPTVYRKPDDYYMNVRRLAA